MNNKENTIYGEHLPQLESNLNELVKMIQKISDAFPNQNNNPIEHISYRIKSDKSIREKCKKQNLPETSESVLTKLYDAIGIRIICTFLNDVYVVRDEILKLPNIEIVTEKDYIKNSKPNGYKSLHLIIRYNGYFAEIQIRTISMDTWAALEHQIKYKKNINSNLELITSELKTCSDELFSTDVKMQVIKNMIDSLQE